MVEQNGRKYFMVSVNVSLFLNGVKLLEMGPDLSMLLTRITNYHKLALTTLFYNEVI